jgi:hypothetical protein
MIPFGLLHSMGVYIDIHHIQLRYTPLNCMARIVLSLQHSMGVYNEMQVQLWADPRLVRKSQLEDAIAR